MTQLPLTSKPSRSRTILLSVVAASIIWLFNELNKEGYTLQVSYPIHLTYNDSLYIPISTLPRSVSVVISGSGWTLLRKSLPFTVTPVTYHLDNPLGTNTINANALAAMMTEQVKDVKISHIVLDNPNLDFDERIEKKVILKIDSLGLNLSPKFVVSSLINLRPKTITFDGPASLVSDIADTILVRVPTKKIRGNFDEEVLIRYPQSPLLSVSAERVFVSFEVAEFLGDTIPSPQKVVEPKKGIIAPPKTTPKKKKKP